MLQIPYDRTAAVGYARKWALKRNPAYYDFENIGGDCTNFASQCIFAGAPVMNFTPDTGWYYRSLSDRASAWSGVRYLYKFLVNNEGVGPYAQEVSQKDVNIGDIVQLGTSDGDFYHTLVITSITPDIFVSAHTYNALDRPLASYDYERAVFLHIDSVRTW